MPSAVFHSNYWAGSADAPAAATETVVSYPRWMTTVTVGSGFGALQAVYERWRPTATTTQVSNGDHRRNRLS